MKRKSNNPTSVLLSDSFATFPEEPLNIKLRRMRVEGVTPMATSPVAYDESINDPYDFDSDIRGDRMKEFEFQRQKSRGEFIDRRTAQYEARRPVDPPANDPNAE